MTIERIKSGKKMGAPFTVQKKVGAVWRNEASLQEESEAIKIAEEVKAAHPHSAVRIVEDTEEKREDDHMYGDSENDEPDARALVKSIFDIDIFTDSML